MLRHQQHLAVYRRTKEFYSWFQYSVFRHDSTERLQSSTVFYWNQSTQSEISFDDYSLNVSLVIQKRGPWFSFSDKNRNACYRACRRLFSWPFYIRLLPWSLKKSGSARVFGYTVYRGFLNRVYGILQLKYGYSVYHFLWISGIKYTWV